MYFLRITPALFLMMPLYFNVGPDGVTLRAKYFLGGTCSVKSTGIVRIGELGGPVDKPLLRKPVWARQRAFCFSERPLRPDSK